MMTSEPSVTPRRSQRASGTRANNQGAPSRAPTREREAVDITDRIKQQVQAYPIVLFMKGTPQFPQCGFSARTVQVLNACGATFAHVNVLAEPEIRQNLPAYSNWPTFPQLFIDGELIGGCDIVMELFQRGELQTLCRNALEKTGAGTGGVTAQAG